MGSGLLLSGFRDHARWCSGGSEQDRMEVLSCAHHPFCCVHHADVLSVSGKWRGKLSMYCIELTDDINRKRKEEHSKRSELYSAMKLMSLHIGMVLARRRKKRSHKRR